MSLVIFVLDFFSAISHMAHMCRAHEIPGPGVEGVNCNPIMLSTKKEKKKKMENGILTGIGKAYLWDTTVMGRSEAFLCRWAWEGKVTA